MDPRQRQLLEKAAQSCNNSMKLVTDLLRLRSLDELREENLVPVNLATVFEHAIDRVRDAAQARTVTLHDQADIAALRLAWIRGDASVLGEVFHVLLDNAIKYTPAGGTVVARLFVEGPAEYAQADASSDARERIVFEVLDSGIGIPADAFEKIFGEFYRAENATRLGISGSGLGLAFAARAAKFMRGSITLTPGDTGGVCARALFPQCPDCVRQAAESGVARVSPGTCPIWTASRRSHSAS
ncbi:MAG: HAMP domain-containing histidine kinase [Acidobacteria bacterium]|nr:HAMP domain-containing histidine kinase [Acidobacteriota bacterium]